MTEKIEVRRADTRRLVGTIRRNSLPGDFEQMHAVHLNVATPLSRSRIMGDKPLWPVISKMEEALRITDIRLTVEKWSYADRERRLTIPMLVVDPKSAKHLRKVRGYRAA